MRSLLFVTAVLTSATFVSACGGEAAPPLLKFPRANTVAQPGALQYRLPVVGNWKVHRTHYGATNDQAYALDLVVDIPYGRGFGGPLRVNTDFPSYNQPVVADAPGVVVIAVDGVPENLPTVVNRYDMHGNFVVIDHRNGEFSLFAHIIPGSLKVRPGMAVAAGMEIGRCGNSGHSTMPHLHWQVMSSANASGAIGIPPRYAPYQRNGVLTTELPQKSDRVAGP
ncbi:MAG TPA: M23 family metallopeptidase [Polyangium sp.]|nr:M23 family metallopeptidase [Polyangium sp.]